MAAKNAKADWPRMLRLLERVRSEDEALEAAVAVEGLLERDSMLISDAEAPAAVPSMPQVTVPRTPAPEQPAAARAMSMVFATAQAGPDR
jgi:hypothetical protein